MRDSLGMNRGRDDDPQAITIDATITAIAMFPCLINSHSSTLRVERVNSFSAMMMPIPEA